MGMKKKNKGKILWLSDSALTVTGYATMTRNILNGLTERGWECLHMGHNYPGQDLIPPINFKDGTPIQFNMTGTGLRPYCEDLIEP